MEHNLGCDLLHLHFRTSYGVLLMDTKHHSDHYTMIAVAIIYYVLVVLLVSLVFSSLFALLTAMNKSLAATTGQLLYVCVIYIR